MKQEIIIFCEIAKDLKVIVIFFCHDFAHISFELKGITVRSSHLMFCLTLCKQYSGEAKLELCLINIG